MINDSIIFIPVNHLLARFSPMIGQKVWSSFFIILRTLNQVEAWMMKVHV